MPKREAARNEVARVHQVATAMERTAELLHRKLNTPVLFVSPPCMLYWGRAFQRWTRLFASSSAVSSRILGSDILSAADTGKKRKGTIDMG